MRKIFKALALAAICASGFSGPALAQPTDAQLSELQNSKIEINYEEPKAASLLPLYERLQKRRVLEDLKAFLSPLRLPRKLTLKTKQCDQINAFYSSSEGLILCYEYIENAEKIAPEKPTPEGFTRQEAFAGGIVNRLGSFDFLSLP